MRTIGIGESALAEKLAGFDLEEPDLTLPHRGIVERNFVLYPLADLAPDLEVPGLGRVAELKGRLAPIGLERLGES